MTHVLRGRLGLPVVLSLAGLVFSSPLAASLDHPWIVNDLSDWYEFSPTGSTAPGEIGLNSWLGPIPDDRGRVGRQGDELVFDGQPIRFWGANIGKASYQTEPANADTAAALYAKYGINLVRYHKFLEQWSELTFDDSSVNLNESSPGFDRFDYLFYRFKQEGIFVNFSPSWHLTIKQADRALVPYWREFYESFNRGSPVLAQAIVDNQATTGTGTFSFDASNLGSGISVGAKVYGVNGAFELDISKEAAPVTTGGGSVTLLRSLSVTNDTGGTLVNRSNSVNFGTGYDYLVVVIWSEGPTGGDEVMDVEEQVIDNLYLGTGPNRIANADFSNLANSALVRKDTLRNSVDDDDSKTTNMLDGKWHYFNPSAWEPDSNNGYFLADGGILDHPRRPFVSTESGFGSIPAFIYFLDEFQEMKIQQIEHLLAHRNPYTGRTYAQDPALAFLEMHNETSIGWLNGYLGVETLPTLRQAACEAFCDWLRNLPGIHTHADLVNRWGADAFAFGDNIQDNPTTAHREAGFPNQNLNHNSIPPWVPNPGTLNNASLRQRAIDTNRFLYETQLAYYQEFKQRIRDAGYTGQVIASNWTWSRNDPHYLNLHSDSEIGVIDRHQYNAVSDQTTLDLPGSAQLGKMNNVQVADRVTMVSEWAQIWTHPSTVEGRFINATYGMGLQGWDAMTFFPGLEDLNSAELIPSPMDFNHQIFNGNSLAVMPFLARQVFRGDVLEGDQPVERLVHIDSILEGNGLGFEDSFVRTGSHDRIETRSEDGSMVLVPEYVPAVAKTQVRFTSNLQQTPAYDLSEFVELDGTDTVYRATNGQLAWHVGAGDFDSKMIVNTPETQGVVGYFEQNEVIDLDDVQIRILDRNQFAAIYVTASERFRRLENSDKLLVLALGRTRNTGMTYDANGRVTNEGTAPVIMEPVRASITFKRTGDMLVTRLDHDGNLLGPVSFDNTNNRLNINGATHQTPYYTVEIAPSGGGSGSGDADALVIDGDFSGSLNAAGSWIFSNDDSHVGTGWQVRETDSAWTLDGANFAKVTSGGVPGMAQIIHDQGRTTGRQNFSFAFANQMPGNKVSVHVWGVNEDFGLNLYETRGPRAIADRTQDISNGGINGAELLADTRLGDLDLRDLSMISYDNVSGNDDRINFGSGYEYIVVCFSVVGVGSGEYVHVDDVVIGGEAPAGDGSGSAGGDLLVNADFTVGLVTNGGWALADSHAGQGWVRHSAESAWTHDAANAEVDAGNSGAQNLVQIIEDNGVTTGTATLTVEASGFDEGDELEVFVYGVDGNFRVNLYNDLGPQTRFGTPTPIPGTELLRQSLTASATFEVPVGSVGYDYLAVMLRSASGSGFSVSSVTLEGSGSAAGSALGLIDGGFDAASLNAGGGWLLFDSNLDAGWVANANGSRWNLDAAANNAYADGSGAQNLAQVFRDDNQSTGPVTLKFDASNTEGMPLSVYVYGSDEPFNLNLYDTKGPRIGATTIPHTVLVDGQGFAELAASPQPREVSFSIPPGGFKYYAVLFRTGVNNASAVQMIDNVRFE